MIIANELKTGEITFPHSVAQQQEIALISIQGQPKYAVMEIEEYERLKEAEIIAAYIETQKEIGQNGGYTGIENHLRNIGLT